MTATAKAERGYEHAIVQAVGWWARRFQVAGYHLPDKIERHLLSLYERLQRDRARAQARRKKARRSR